MNEWLQKQIENGFQEFAGLSITAHLPVRDRLLNEALAELLHGRPASAVELGSKLKFDARSLLPLVKKAEVHAKEGALVLDIEVKV